MEKKDSETQGTLQGIAFECVEGCVACCETPGLVFVCSGDIAAMAEFFKMSRSDFTEKYLIYRGADFYVFDMPEEDPCIFIKDKKCAIYEVRPAQCRTYPFWPDNMSSVEEWDTVMKTCPGIGRGRTYSVEEITDIAAEAASSYSPFAWGRYSKSSK